MAKINISLSMPKYWHPRNSKEANFGMTELGKNSALAKAALEFNHKLTILGKELFLVPLAGGAKLLLGINNGKVVFLSKYLEKRDLVLDGYVVQQAVWRASGKEADAYKGFPTRLLLNHYLPTYGKVVSDEMQSSFGKRLWLRFGEEAIDSNNFVYVYDTSRVVDALLPVTSMEDVADDSTADIWGDEDKHLKKLLVISKTVLKASA